MSGNNSVGARILAAQLRHCEQLTAALVAARKAGASAHEIADLEEQELAARKRYQELAVDIPGQGRASGARSRTGGQRPWWRFW
ncbi:MAG TPA: hypothetical protein PKA05_17840 [Roseiflexaceae bacterium]|nr:hypothetical protein [Roseiflexaceae bacterium]HMP42245.1 hypothetical protein [Roseiflexaceae bacterium]